MISRFLPRITYPAFWLGLVLATILSWPTGVAASPVTVVVDADSGQVLLAEEPNALWYPASLTKMMTVYIAFAEIKAGRHKLDETVTVSPTASGQQPVKFGLRSGEKITLQQAINATIVASANDAAVAIAEQIGGTQSDFAQRMTETAHRLGMSRTNFRNATGLPDAQQVTTAADMARLGLALLHDFPEYYHFFSDRSVSINGRTLPTVNGILVSYNGADGIKTGFTCGAGYNLVASAKRGGRRLVGVLLGGGNRGERASQMTSLLNAGFSRDSSQLPLLRDLSLKIDVSEDSPPPIRLKAGECDQTTVASGGATGNGTIRMAGWGTVFGSYPNVKQAHEALAIAKLAIPKELAGRGQAAIVRKDYEGIARYSALLVGFGQIDAGRACKAMWDSHAYCLALSPQVLGNPQALWR
jgi:D-alanyl-D-alanine carboxypeptidase